LSVPIILAVVGLTVLSGAALLQVVRAERRKATIALRLKAIAAGPPTAELPLVSLLRPPPQRRALPAVLCARLDAALAATGNRIGLPHLAVIGITAAVLVGSTSAVTVFRPPLAIIAAGASMVGAPTLILRRAQTRYQRRFLDVFPDALDLIVRAVRAGLPAPEAIEAATREIRPPVGTEFQRMLDEMRIGVEMEDALQRAADRVRVPDFQFFVVSLLLQRQTGAGIAETLANLSTIIRQRKAVRQKARALTAEATASAAIVATMPFVAGVGLFLINQQLMSILLTDRRGRFMLGLAVICLLLGMAAMKTMIKKSLD
jgi:tight adherence protein B